MNAHFRSELILRDVDGHHAILHEPLQFKRCSRCNETLPASAFSKRVRSRDGLAVWCRGCFHSYHMENQAHRRQRDRGRFRERARRYYRRTKAERPHVSLVDSARRRAARVGVPCTITYSDVTVPNECPLCGVEMKAGGGLPLPTSPTLDRILPREGYTPSNVWVICASCNRTKGDIDPEMLLRLMRVFQERGLMP